MLIWRPGPAESDGTADGDGAGAAEATTTELLLPTYLLECDRPAALADLDRSRNGGEETSWLSSFPTTTAATAAFTTAVATAAEAAEATSQSRVRSRGSDEARGTAATTAESMLLATGLFLSAISVTESKLCLRLSTLPLNCSGWAFTSLKKSSSLSWKRSCIFCEGGRACGTDSQPTHGSRCTDFDASSGSRHEVDIPPAFLGVGKYETNASNPKSRSVTPTGTFSGLAKLPCSTERKLTERSSASLPLAKTLQAHRSDDFASSSGLRFCRVAPMANARPEAT
mmetsp:Transcript_98082/g.245771  ORF Transcript_98082/g.245771 Transcript_98082/m.245771 type:complete len:284 (+) Transcript_98082:635-1486(+)